MKKILILLFAVSMLAGCGKGKSGEVPPVVIPVTDTVEVVNRDSINLLIDSIHALNIKLEDDRITESEFMCQARLNRIKKYISICESNPSQKTFHLILALVLPQP